MPNSNTLAARDDAQWELVFVIEGVSIAFCSHRFLEALSTGQGHTMRRGLERDGMRRRLEVDMRKGSLVPQTMRVKLHDHVGDLADVFKADRDDFEYLDLTIGPSDDLSLRPSLHGMHVGTELIGPAGERRQYAVPLGDDLGRQHYAGSWDSQLGAVPSKVSSAPIVWTGRRCALYRVYRDHVTYPGDYSEGWRPASEWQMIWWGAMRDDGRVSGRLWELECGGPETWLQKDLGLLTQRTPVGVQPTFAYSAEEAQAGGWVGHVPGIGGAFEHGDLEFAPVFTGDTLEELRAEFAAFITGLASNNGPEGAWNSYSGNVLAALGGGRTLAFRHSSSSPGVSGAASLANEGRIHIALHMRMWARLGWDISAAESNDGYSYSFEPTPILVGEPPSGEYVALKVDILRRDDPVFQIEPHFSGGVAPLDPTRINADGQILQLSPNTSGSVTHHGQIFAPVASDPDNASAGYPLSSACDTQGLWLLQGDRRFAGQEDVFEESAIVQCSWVDQQGSMLNNQMVATRLWNPRHVGISRGILSSTWTQQANAIDARPLLYLGYQQSSGYDLAHLVMQRVLLSTGTSTGWSGFADEAPISNDPGDNDPPILAGFVRLDTERADLGLAIPETMIQSPFDWHVAAQTAPDEASEVFVAIEPGTNSEDVFKGLMHPLGFAWSLAGGSYGIFTPHEPIQESEVQWVLTRAEQEGDYGQMGEPGQDLREYAPVDAFEVDWSAVLYGDGYRYKAKIDAADQGRRYRTGGITEPIAAPYHRRSSTQGLRERQSARAAFWERRHYTLDTFPVLPSVGRRVWPGEGARLTHPLLVDPVAAGYGVTARRARIYSVEEDLSRERSRFKLGIVAYAERTSTPRVHAPIARGYGFDSDEDRISVYDDCLGLGGGRSDAATFVEPDYVGLEPFGGNLEIAAWQWDGTGWAVTCTGVVQSVVTTPGASSIRLASITGTYYPCMDTYLVPVGVDLQTALYAQTLFVGIGNESGTTGPGPNQRFEDV